MPSEAYPLEGVNGGETPDARKTRTASDTQSCRRCGSPMRGRRRNGFCSDRCRMAARREGEANRRRQAIDRLKAAVTAVEGELLAGGDDGGAKS
jgi:hypothetical protein